MKLKNKKGNVFLNIGISIFIWISGILMLPFLYQDLATTRTQLNCANMAVLSSGTKMICLGISGVAPYFIWFIASVALGFLIGGLKK